MSKKGPFNKPDPQQQQDYTREARLQYDPQIVSESMKRWNDYTELQKEGVIDEGNRIYGALADALTAGKAATDSDVQALLARWHDHMRHFYEPSLDLLRGLGQLYNSDARFMATFEALHPDLPAFLEAAIEQYVDELETAAIARLLEEENEEETRHTGNI